jgi:hypothetical protein
VNVAIATTSGELAKLVTVSDLEQDDSVRLAEPDILLLGEVCGELSSSVKHLRDAETCWEVAPPNDK